MRKVLALWWATQKHPVIAINSMASMTPFKLDETVIASGAKQSPAWPMKDCFVAKPPRNDRHVVIANSPAQLAMAQSLALLAANFVGDRNDRQVVIASGAKQSPAWPMKDCFVAKPPRNDKNIKTGGTSRRVPW